MVLSVQRILINSLPLMSKGEEKQQRSFIIQSEEEYFHQCQRGRLLEILSLMAKEVAKELASDTVTRNREKKHSRGQRSAEKNRERVHVHRVVSVKEKIEFSRKDI